MAELTPKSLIKLFFAGHKKAHKSNALAKRQAIARKKREDLVLCRELGCSLEELV